MNILTTQNVRVSKSKSHVLPTSLIKIFEHIRENALFYRVMLEKKGDSNFAEKIHIFIQQRIQYSLPANLTIEKKRLDLFVNHSSYASFDAVLW